MSLELDSSIAPLLSLMPPTFTQVLAKNPKAATSSLVTLW
jgi:hypothetical protein